LYQKGGEIHRKNGMLVIFDGKNWHVSDVSWQNLPEKCWKMEMLCDV
jgi:hypothetical protein